MAKKKKQPQPFGSRKGTDFATIRGGRVSMENNSSVWFKDMAVMIDESAAMVSAAQIVPAYFREHGNKLPEELTASANDSMNVLSGVIKSHKESVTELRTRLGKLREGNPGTRLTTALSISMMDLAGDVQNLMNDFANVGFFAIDAALEPYRTLAMSDTTVVAPLYMAPTKAEQQSFNTLENAGPKKEITVIGLPGELPVDVDPTKSSSAPLTKRGETVPISHYDDAAFLNKEGGEK